jgi:hypothetical protein
VLGRAVVDSGVGVGPQLKRERANRTATSNDVSSLFNFISQSRSFHHSQQIQFWLAADLQSAARPLDYKSSGSNL